MATEDHSTTRRMEVSKSFPSSCWVTHGTSSCSGMLSHTHSPSMAVVVVEIDEVQFVGRVFNEVNCVC